MMTHHNTLRRTARALREQAMRWADVWSSALPGRVGSVAEQISALSRAAAALKLELKQCQSAPKLLLLSSVAVQEDRRRGGEEERRRGGEEEGGEGTGFRAGVVWVGLWVEEHAT
eukprot:3875305-Rhodomonas_salina.2